MADLFTPENLQSIYDLKATGSQLGERLEHLCRHGLPVERRTKGVVSTIRSGDIWKESTAPSMSMVWMVDSAESLQEDKTLILIDYKSEEVFRLKLGYDWRSRDEARSIELVSFKRTDERSWEEIVTDLLEADGLTGWDLGTLQRLKVCFEELRQGLSWSGAELNRNWEWEEQIVKKLRTNEKKRLTDPLTFARYLYRRIRDACGLQAPWE